MSTSPSPFTYRRCLGRAPSPPTWAWYEQIPIEDDDSETDSVEEDSCSEDDEDYGHRDQQEHEHDRSSESSGEELDSPALGGVHIGGGPRPGQETASGEGEDGETDQVPECGAETDKMDVEGGEGLERKDLKGKQRAVDTDVQENPRRRERRKKPRQPVFTFRPILTIQKSQGFVWNQDLFVPPYIKDRYVASTSPPIANGPYGSSSPLNVNDYEVDVVEIRVKEGEFANIIP